MDKKREFTEKESRLVIMFSLTFIMFAVSCIIIIALMAQIDQKNHQIDELKKDYQGELEYRLSIEAHESPYGE